MRASFRYTPLDFKRPAGTSRGVLLQKHSWLIEIEQEGKVGIGECSIIPELSPDFTSIAAYESKLHEVVDGLESKKIDAENARFILAEFPSILFGVECAFLDLKNGGKQCYFDNAFSRGEKHIPINGLVWMGDEAFMQQQIEEKIKSGFSTIKMKIGAIDFESEFALLKSIRTHYKASQMTLRVDANGAFSPEKTPEILQRLAQLEIHSIEQPIKAGNWKAMKDLCAQTPCPIALDEELIGIHDLEKKKKLLETIQPQYIILKPSLHGGISGTKQWIELAEKQSISWWMTSALESNIGLKAICEFAAEYENELPQGLGTGSLYVRNFESRLHVENGSIFLK